MKHTYTCKFTVAGARLLLLLTLVACYPALAVAQSADEAVVRSLAEKFAEAYEKKDILSLLSNWDASPAYLSTIRTRFEKAFSSTCGDACRKLTVREITVTGRNASARMRVDVSKSSGGLALESLSDKTSYILRFRRDGDPWVVSEFELSSDELAAAIENAKTEQEQKALIAIHQPFVTSELPRSLVKRARSLITERSYIKATSLNELALGLAMQLGDKAMIAAALQTKGQLDLLEGNYNRALEPYHSALKLSEELNDKASMATIRNGLGTVYRSQANYALALEYLQKALKLAEEIADKEQTAIAFNNIGKVQHMQGNYDVALENLEKGLKLAEEIGNQEQVALILANIGNVFEWQGKYSQALSYYQGTLRIGEQRSDKRLIGNASINMGNVYMVQGKYSDALASMQKALRLEEELGDKSQVAVVFNNLAIAHSSQHNYSLSLEYNQKCLKLAEEIGDKGLILSSSHNIGAHYRAEGDYFRALEYFLKAMRLADELGEKSNIIIIRLSIGGLYSWQGNYAQALEYYQSALNLSQRIGDKPMVALSLRSVGGIYLRQNKYQEAQENYRRALEILQQIGDKPGVANSFSYLGYLYMAKKADKQALEAFQQALKVEEEIGDKVMIASSFCNIAGIYYMQNRLTEAIELADRAAEIASQTGRANLFWIALGVAGKAYAALNEPDKAQRAFEEAISKIEIARSHVIGGEQERQQFFENKLLPYKAMVDLLVSQKKEISALIYAEKAKARALLDVLRNGRINIAKNITPQEKEQEQQLYGDMIYWNSQIYRMNSQSQPDPARAAALERQLQRARLRYEAFQTTLYATHPELKVSRGEARTIGAEEIADLLPDMKTALLEYVVTDEQIHLFVATKANEANENSLRLNAYTIKIEKKDAVESVERFRAQLANRDLDFRQNARQLYDLLIKPAGTQLRGKSSIIIVPDGILWELPFQALQSSGNRFLLEDFSLSYVPSLTVLREMRKLKQERAKNTSNAPALLAFGNPTLFSRAAERVELAYRGEKLQPLPEAGAEAKSLGQLYGPANSKVCIGPDAREDRFKTEAGKFTILHLATHAILDNSLPMYSQVVLSQENRGENEDGLLEAWEVMKLDLKSTLVVLSGCETARGRIGEGEGVIGLTWAFFVAGSPTTVVSQWKVESESSTGLMLEFHRNLKNVSSDRKIGSGTAVALRGAAMKLLRSVKYRHPFYWAAFVVVGDGS